MIFKGWMTKVRLPHGSLTTIRLHTLYVTEKVVMRLVRVMVAQGGPPLALNDHWMIVMP